MDGVVFRRAIFVEEVLNWYVDVTNRDIGGQAFLDTGDHVKEGKLDRVLRIVNVKVEDVVERPSQMILCKRLGSLNTKCLFHDASLVGFHLLHVLDGPRLFLIYIQVLFELLLWHLLDRIRKIQLGGCTLSYTVVLNLNIWIVEFDGLVRMSVRSGISFHVVYSCLDEVDLQATDGFSIFLTFGHI